VNKNARVRRGLPRDARPGFGVRRSEDASPQGCFPRACRAGRRGRRGGDGVLVDDLMAIAIEQHAERFPAA
jgi:hypothetical protein